MVCYAGFWAEIFTPLVRYFLINADLVSVLVEKLIFLSVPIGECL